MTTPHQSSPAVPAEAEQVRGPGFAVVSGSSSSALADKIVTAIEGRFRDWLMSGEHAEARKLVADIIADEIERLDCIIEAANKATTFECTCGGNPADDPECCPACKVYHRIEAAKVRYAPNIPHQRTPEGGRETL